MLIHLIACDTPDGPTRRFPTLLLARVFARIEMKRPAIDFDDEAISFPAQVCFFTCDAHV